MKYDVEMYTGIKIEDLFYKYRDLAAKTVNKYYSRYISTAWQEDVYNVAEMGLYESLQNIELGKIKNELSIKSAIIWGVRGSIKNWEREKSVSSIYQRALNYKNFGGFKIAELMI